MSNAGRHLSPNALTEYIEAGVPASIPVLGEPQALLTIDPDNDVMRLEVSWDGEQPPSVQSYVHISTDVVFHGGTNWAVMTVRGTNFFQEAYPLLCSVADLVQLEGQTFASAVLDSLRAYHDLLAATGSMSAQDEIGLYGELLVLEHLIDRLGGVAAMACWRGSTHKEEHDFGLADDDVEVKTTVAEGRRHWIGSLSQLSQTIDRPLWLLSIQLTTAGLHDGRLLPDVVEAVERVLPSALVVDYRARINAGGFREAQPRETFRSLRLRTRPACYEVLDTFPRLTHAMLESSGADLDRVDEVSYTIRLDNVKPSNPVPDALTDYVQKVDHL